jgi:hypothetical protein
VRHESRRLILPFVLVHLGLVIALGIRPVATVTILGAYLIALAALALELVTRVLSARSRAPGQSAFEHALERRPVERTRPPDVLRIERELTLGSASAGHLHMRLLPLLREIAVARLGFDIGRSPERARTLLGDDVWELLRPDRPAPVDRNAPGVHRRELERCIDALERA